MIKALVFFLASCIPFAAQESGESIPQDLVGIWKLESTSFKGSVPTKPDSAIWLVIMDNGDFVFKNDKDVQAGTVAVDSSVVPFALDIRVELKSGVQRKWTNLGIYEIKEGTLTIAKAPEGRNRPSHLQSDAETVVQVFRRSTD